MTKLSSEKFNIILIILVFLIPLVALNCSFWIIRKIEYDWEEKILEDKALNEAETLAVEGDFNTEFAMHFNDFFDEMQIKANSGETNDSFFTNEIEQTAKRTFEYPFPNYNLYVFKIPNNNQETELLYSYGSLKAGKKSLCRAFLHLYNTKVDSKDKSNEFFAKSLLGSLTDINAIAKDMKGIPTYTNGVHKSSWFIWDYAVIQNKGIYGAILLCNEIDNHAEYGRLLALKKLRKRGNAIGAFVPLYKDYGNANILSPLNKSDSFKKWADSLTIKNKKYLDRWLKESLPQNFKLGNYSAFCHLKRNTSHIAIVLVKSNKINYFPKWLVSIDLFILLTLTIILYSGICFGYWPQLKLRTRFILSYALASVVPLSLLFVTANGYLLEFEKTQEELANNELQLSLKDFDSLKLTNIREYKLAFNKVANDPKLIKLIEENGVDSNIVTNYVVNYFESDNPEKESLPILGVKFYDEIGNGAFSKGSVSTNIDIEILFKSYTSVILDILRVEIKKDDPNIVLKDYEKNDDNDLAKNAYNALTGRELKKDMYKYFGIPIPRKNGDFCGYQVLDTIKINGKTKYMLNVMWDDKTLDERIIKKAIQSNALGKRNQNFIVYKINGQKPKYLGEKTRHVSEELREKIDNYVKEASYLKKTGKHTFEDNIIVVMPAFNFNQIIFVGWINKIGIFNDLFKRKTLFVILIITSLFMLRISSIRSSSVFLKPITTLKKALDEVSLGHLNIGFKDNPDNELGKLSNEFDKMIEELREKERLSKLISDQAVEALKKNSSGLLNDTETFKGVALVSDIRNFTGMSEKYDPVIITELLNEHFAEMAKIISDNGGLIYKFIGDAIEAVFPEKEDLEKSAIERAFQAGCLMIKKLKAINIRRTKINSFTYKIGVGLCYGTMYSGTVGSLETRLDYSILGDPLKKAAKFEALTIQNPEFPITLDEIIAEKMAAFGYNFKKIDSKNQDYNLYTLNESLNNINSDTSFASNKESLVNINEIQDDKINYFSLSGNSSFFKKHKDLIFYFFLVLYISLLITFAVFLLYKTSHNSLKPDSDNYGARLREQLKCDGVLQSSFETLCFEFYDDLKKLDFYKNPKNLKEKIEQIALKYDKIGVSIPKYCCCFLEKNKIPENERIVYKGFSEDVCNSFYYYSNKYREFIEKYKNNDKNKDISRENNIDFGDDTFENILTAFTSKGNRFYNFHQGIFFRRSSSTYIGNEEMLFDTNRIYDDNKNNIIAYIFCGMPENINKDILPYYYTFLAGKQMLMAIKNKNGWYFSPDFPEKEKELIQKNPNNSTIADKGYLCDTININNETFIIYTISRDLFNNYYPFNKLVIVTFVLSFIILSLVFCLLDNNKIFINNSIATILRKDIFLSAIIPLLTVCFVSYLYVEEESNIRKSELLLNLNQQMNEIESREFYYSPLCKLFLKNLPYLKEIEDSLIKIKNNKGEERKEERNNECEKLSKYLKENIIGRKYKKVSFATDSIDPFFVIKEIIFTGKDDWTASAIENDKIDKNYSQFGDKIIKIVKSAYLKENISSNSKKNKDAITGGFISEKILEILSSAYGSDIALKLTNYPNNLIIVANSYSSIGLYVCCYPDTDNPDFVSVFLIYFDNEFRPFVCNLRNDNLITYKTHLASNSMDDKIFCFFSPNAHVGEFFFHDRWYVNHREELKTVKELGLAASWINTSFIPLSKKVDINGMHYLEAKQGNYIKDSVFAALGSEYPIKENKKEKLITFGSIILFSLIMIFLIAQSIISDLLDPVKKLINGAIEVSKGNYKFRTNFIRKDELGTLCFSFDKMMKGLEEKQLMNRMVSQTALKVASDLSEIQSKKVNVVLLYITVPGFDNIMQKTPVNELFANLRKQIASISKIVIDNGGDIDKIMGEKLLIAFRVKNNSPEEVAYNASQVANLINYCNELCYEVSIGVNYGEVISGYLGVGEKRDFTIIGDPVNVAARIAVFGEKLESNRLIVSERIMQLVKERLETKEFGEVLFKGKTNPSKVYKII